MICSARIRKSNDKSSSSQVKTLKERIEEEKGKDNFSVAGLKLIYAGMLLFLSKSALP